MYELLAEVSDRGIGAPRELAEDIYEVVSDLEAASAGDVLDWANSPSFGGRWRLSYTSSKTFANNCGLSGYARDIAGVSTPELYMDVEITFKRLVYEEPLVLQSGSLAAMFGKFANAEKVEVECTYSRTRDNVMAVASNRVVVGAQSWAPADRQDKAVRTLGAGRPVFLDDDLFVLRSQPDNVWVFVRA